MNWADLDAAGRAALLEEAAARGVHPHEAPDLESPIEPAWVNTDGDFVALDGRVLPPGVTRVEQENNRTLIVLVGLVAVASLAMAILGKR